MTTSLINQSNVKAFIRSKVERLRPGWNGGKVNVSRKALEIIDARLRLMIVEMVKSHPTVGKTFKGS